MAVIGWGKPKIFVKDLDAESPEFIELPTPVEDSTSLETTKGDKTEAKVEGGENEDVKYAKNTYALTLTIRAAKGRKKPVADEDGIITHNYEVLLQPEDPEVDGFHLAKTKVSIEDGWSAADGGTWVYTFDALKTDGHKQIEWGKVTGTSASNVSFTETQA